VSQISKVVSGSSTARSTRDIIDSALSGGRLDEPDLLQILRCHDRDIWEICAAADEIRSRAVGNVVTWVRNQNINVTNICVNNCGFCGFSRKVGDPDAYFYSKDMIRERAAQARERGVTEICTVSGLHPGFDTRSYVQVYSWLREEAPGVHIHAGNPMEVAYAARKSGISTKEVLRQFKEAGLSSMCGTAAEILVDPVRKIICPGKISTAEWVRIIEEAHRMGIPTTATIMYGHCETVEDRVRHLSLLREIQDSTGGFTEFVPLSFIHMNTPLYREGKARAGATGREDLLMVAGSRLFLDNITHIQVSWVKLGQKMAQMCLMAGGDDLGGTMFEERISRGAGAQNTDYLDPAEMQRIAEDIGRELVQRTTLYERV
jgi:FO synthase subunit 2